VQMSKRTTPFADMENASAQRNMPKPTLIWYKATADAARTLSFSLVSILF
jgi:hypothetical protein